MHTIWNGCDASLYTYDLYFKYYIFYFQDQFYKVKYIGFIYIEYYLKNHCTLLDTWHVVIFYIICNTILFRQL